MKRKSIIIITIILLILVGGSLGLSSCIKSINEELNNIEINDIDLSTIEDGIYQGEYSTVPVKAVVKVTVENHKIIKIDLIKHDNGQGEKAEVITQDVIEKQKLSVDLISGATYSSKVILKAIENALKSENTN